MLKTLTAAFSIVALSAGAAFAEKKPWELPKPKGMTVAHEQIADVAKTAHESLPAGQFGLDPKVADWDYQRGKRRDMPLANMTVAGLNSLTLGHYHIQTFGDTGKWSVRYYSPNGRTFYCNFDPSRKTHVEFFNDRYVVNAEFGMAGILNWNPVTRETPKPPKKGMFGFPYIYGSDSGLLYSYWWDKGKRTWRAEPGWIQKEYAAAFAEKCPNLPRVSNVNGNQMGDTFQALWATAKPIRGAKVAFPNDPRDPLTASMYYWSYQPK